MTTVDATRSPAATGLAGFLANTTRIGGIAGIAYVVLFIVGVVIQGDTPMIDDDAATVREFFGDGDDANMFLLGDWLTGVAFVVFFLPFLSALRTFLAPADPSGGTWVRAMFAGGLLILAAGGASTLTFGGLATGGADGLDDSTLDFANAQASYGFSSFVSLAMTAYLLSAGLVILAGGRLWRWLGAAALVVALLNIVGALQVLDPDPETALGVLGIVGFLGFGLWNLAASIGMLMRSRAEAS
jgi:hypothetical protein